MRLSEYRVMWVIVFFDMPTETKKQKKEYRKFRKNLLKDGFTKFQFSIYIRHALSFENSTTHINRVKNFLPDCGEICILRITDKQFGMIELFNGFEKAKPPDTQGELIFL